MVGVSNAVVRVVLQRVREALVAVIEDGAERDVARIGPGLLALAGFAVDEDEAALGWMAAKIADLRVFEGRGSGFDRSLRDTGGGPLIVSQFTLYRDARKGRRPDFVRAAGRDQARALHERVCDVCRAELPGRVASGEFGARMAVRLINDGPVTLWLER